MKTSSVCGVCSLQTGAAIAGGLYFTGGLAIFITNIVAIARNYPVCTNYNYSLQILPCDYEKVITNGLLIYSAIILIMSTFQIIGAVNKNVTYIYSSACMAFTNLVTATASAIGYITCSIHTSDPHYPTILFSWTIMLIIYGVIFYLWLITSSYYKNLVADKFQRSSDNKV